MEKISNELKKHYDKTFKTFGPTAQGVDWGIDSKDMFLRYEKMLDLILNKNEKSTLLDVGCGFGGFLNYLMKKKIKKLDYFGIDIVEEMIVWAKKKYNENFINDDFLIYEWNRKFDYVICNGILTQKLSTSQIMMENYLKLMIKKMFSISNRGIAFNVMSTKVNFFSNNLFYKSPIELFSYCYENISSNIKIDHSYRLYEYTIYLYK